MRYAFDRTNSAIIPSKGLRVTAEGRWYTYAPLSEDPFPQGEFTAIYFKPLSEKGSVLISQQLGTTFNKNAPPELQFTLGGPFRLGAYDYQEFRGNHYFLSSLGYMHQIGQLSPLLGRKIYGITWFDAGGAYQDFKSPVVQYQGTAGFIMDTKMGAVSILGAVGKGGKGQIYFAFGKLF